ncbi:hypothetical protein KPH14_005955 [Odynerus spinipes]|uniref:Uncharacterized protein n=1 Tax=Odynerus spinipes TaxID=1348599 RepID=A0AAD9RK14_9HYME|nr:hypothetical protein KPH14_005955 [Odynerus spinipes]
MFLPKSKVVIAGRSNSSSAGEERTSRMSCEKASRRLRYLIAKAKRLGLTTEEVAELPAIKRLVPARVMSSTWMTLFMIVLILGGSFVLVFLCAPCVARSRT